LDAAFNDGDVVDREALNRTGLAKGPADGIRILGQGELTKKLTVKAHHFTKSAAEKITAKGGTMEVIPPPKKPVRNKMRPRPPKVTARARPFSPLPAGQRGGRKGQEIGHGKEYPDRRRRGRVWRHRDHHAPLLCLRDVPCRRTGRRPHRFLAAG